MEKHHDRRGNCLLTLAALAALLLAYLLIFQGLRAQRRQSVYADAVLVLAPCEVQGNEA